MTFAPLESPRYSPREARRHDVRTGIAVLAQVKVRNPLPRDEKFEWDVRYVEQQSLWLDLRILGLTVKTVLVREGISAQGDVTMPEFNPGPPPAADPARTA